jgi:hypothetical protein
MMLAMGDAAMAPAAEDRQLAEADRRAVFLSRALSPLGWECTHAEIDLDAGTARIGFKHGSGRIVTVAVDGLGRASVTREQLLEGGAHVKHRGNCFLERPMTTEFLGRTRHEGIRSALRTVANYLADNTGVDRALTRAPLAGLLTMAATPAEETGR